MPWRISVSEHVACVITFYIQYFFFIWRRERERRDGGEFLQASPWCIVGAGALHGCKDGGDRPIVNGGVLPFSIFFIFFFNQKLVLYQRGGLHCER